MNSHWRVIIGQWEVTGSTPEVSDYGSEGPEVTGND